jgi:virginiamycin B lyase
MGAHVYWTNYNSGTIGRAHLDGSGVRQNFITGASSPTDVAVHGKHIYWANLLTIGRANLDGSGVDQNFITGANFRPQGLAVDGKHIYWTNLPISGPPSDSTIGRAKLDGSAVNQNLIAGLNVSYGVAVDGKHIYWGEQPHTTSNGTISANGTIGRANLDGSGVDRNFITAEVSPGGIAVHGKHIYWGDERLTDPNSTIGRAHLLGGRRRLGRASEHRRFWRQPELHHRRELFIRDGGRR